MTSGFGLERLGLVALCFPRITLCGVAVLTLFFGFLSLQLKFDSDVREIFRSSDRSFSVLERMSEQYRGNENSVFLLVEGEALFNARALESVRRLHNELYNVERVEEVFSAFSALRAPSGGTGLQPLLPTELESVANFEALKAEVLTHALVADRLVANDGDAFLMIANLDQAERSLEQTAVLINDILQTGRLALHNSGLSVRLAGTPVVQLELIGALKRDQAVFKTVGLLFGMAITWAFFRNWRFVVVTMLPALVAITWLLGTQNLIGLKIDVLNNVVPVIVMAIAFADSMHLVFAIRQARAHGKDSVAAIGQAVRQVGPACALTSLTTALALATLVFSPHAFISNFGLIATVSTVLTFLATILCVPALAALLLDHDALDAASGQTPASPLARLCMRTSMIVQNSSNLLIVTGCVLLVVSLVGYLSTSPRYAYRDHLPATSDVEGVMQEIDDRFSGTAEIVVFLEFPKGEDPLWPENLEIVQAVHEIIEAERAMKQVRSLSTVNAWLRTADGTSTKQEKSSRPNGEAMDYPFGLGRPDSYLGLFASELGVYSAEHASALVVAQHPDLPSNELLPILDRVHAALLKLISRFPGLKAEVTSIDALSARMSLKMIEQLNFGLLLAVVMVIVLIGAANMSITAAAVSILPNLLPLGIGGAYLFFTSNGLQFSSVIAFTVGFGVSVDNTIQFLNRYRIELAKNNGVEEAMQNTIAAIGPVIICSTLIIIAGTSLTLASAMPLVTLFGEVVVIVLTVALLGSILLLPALILTLSSWTGKCFNS